METQNISRGFFFFLSCLSLFSRFKGGYLPTSGCQDISEHDGGIPQHHNSSSLLIKE